MREGVRCYSGKKTLSCGGGRGRRLAVLSAIVPCLMVYLLWSPARTNGDSLCDGCLNGGRLLMPNNIFGSCRCKCYGDFKGPKCQFLYKRSLFPPARYASSPAVDSDVVVGSEEDAPPKGERESAQARSPHPSSSLFSPSDKREVFWKLEELKALIDGMSNATQTDNSQEPNSYKGNRVFDRSNALKL